MDQILGNIHDLLSTFSMDNGQWNSEHFNSTLLTFQLSHKPTEANI